MENLSQRKVLVAFQWRVEKAALWKPKTNLQFHVAKYNRKHTLEEILPLASLFNYKIVTHTHMHLRKIKLWTYCSNTHAQQRGVSPGLPVMTGYTDIPAIKSASQLNQRVFLDTRIYEPWWKTERQGGKHSNLKLTQMSLPKVPKHLVHKPPATLLICHGRQEIFDPTIRREREINSAMKEYGHSNIKYFLIQMSFTGNQEIN